MSEKIKMLIPRCGLEGWDYCTHVMKPKRTVKRNIGL